MRHARLEAQICAEVGAGIALKVGEEDLGDDSRADRSEAFAARTLLGLEQDVEPERRCPLEARRLLRKASTFDPLAAAPGIGSSKSPWRILMSISLLGVTAVVDPSTWKNMVRGKFYGLPKRAGRRPRDERADSPGPPAMPLDPVSRGDRPAAAQIGGGGREDRPRGRAV